jgi:hypothetical protein
MHTCIQQPQHTEWTCLHLCLSNSVLGPTLSISPLWTSGLTPSPLPGVKGVFPIWLDGHPLGQEMDPPPPAPLAYSLGHAGCGCTGFRGDLLSLPRLLSRVALSLACFCTQWEYEIKPKIFNSSFESFLNFLFP